MHQFLSEEGHARRDLRLGQAVEDQRAIITSGPEQVEIMIVIEDPPPRRFVPRLAVAAQVLGMRQDDVAAEPGRRPRRGPRRIRGSCPSGKRLAGSITTYPPHQAGGAREVAEALGDGSVVRVAGTSPEEWPSLQGGKTGRAELIKRREFVKI